jgi:hypothetical protein
MNVLFLDAIPVACTYAHLIGRYCLLIIMRSRFPSRAVDSVQSKSFATDLSNLKDLFEQSKTELFLESRAKAQLATECQGLTKELKERVRQEE